MRINKNLSFGDLVIEICVFLKINNKTEGVKTILFYLNYGKKYRNCHRLAKLTVYGTLSG